MVITCVCFILGAIISGYFLLSGSIESSSEFVTMAIGFILLGSVSIYLLFFAINTWKNYISYDEHSVVFHFKGNDERRISWLQMQHSEIIIKWMDADTPTLRFAFEDGNKIDITAMAYEGYKDLYEMMRKQGVLERYNLEDQSTDLLKEIFEKEMHGIFDDPNYKRRVIGPFTISKRVNPTDDQEKH